MHVKRLSAWMVCCVYLLTLLINIIIKTVWTTVGLLEEQPALGNSMIPWGAVWSGSTLFDQEALKYLTVLLLWIICVIYFLWLSCFFLCSLVPCGHLLGKGWPLGSCLWCLLWFLLLSHVVSWVRCGTWLYRFLIFSVFLTLKHLADDKIERRLLWLSVYKLQIQRAQWERHQVSCWKQILDYFFLSTNWHSTRHLTAILYK